MGHLVVWRPAQQSLLGHLVHQGQQGEVAFDEHRPRALITPIFGGPSPDLSALVLGDGVEPILAGLAAGQDVSGMQLPARATAVEFAALASEQVKGALDHRLGALEAAQGVGQGRVSTPELLAELGKVGAQSESLIQYKIQIASGNLWENEKSRVSSATPPNPVCFTWF